MSVEQPSGSNAVAAQAPTPTMMSQVPFPPRLELKSNLAKTWKSWKQLWDAYETVTGLNEKDSKLRVATFVTCIGPDALDIHNGLPFQNDEEKGDMNKILELWNSYCIGETNICILFMKDINSIIAIKILMNLLTHMPRLHVPWPSLVILVN